MACAYVAPRTLNNNLGGRIGWNDKVQRRMTIPEVPSRLDRPSDTIDLAAELRNARVENRRHAKFGEAGLDRIDACDPAI